MSGGGIRNTSFLWKLLCKSCNWKCYEIASLVDMREKKSVHQKCSRYWENSVQSLKSNKKWSARIRYVPAEINNK